VSEYYADKRVAEAYDRALEGPRQPDTTDDVPFYVDLARAAAARGERVLELGCGTGRVTLPIADAGAEVVGLDSSAAMLAIARRKRDDGNPRWVEADMRDFDLAERFGLVMIPFRSFLHLLTPADQRACLARVREHLLPGGRFALNFFNPDPRLLALAKLETIDPRSFISRVERRMKLRHVTRAEMDALLAEAGFRVEALYGWFDKRRFEPGASELVYVTIRT
jgi:SAM-dependent methyltransferase